MKHIITYTFIALLFLGIAIAGGSIGVDDRKPVERPITISIDASDKYTQVYGKPIDDKAITDITEKAIDEKYLKQLRLNISDKIEYYFMKGTPVMLQRLNNCLSVK